MKNGLIIFISIFIIVSNNNIWAQNYIFTLDDVINAALISSLESEKLDINRVILETNIEIYGKAYLPTLNLSLSGPNYNHSISPIIQPDGSKKFQEVNTASYNSSLQLNYSIWLTGGNISIQSSMNQLNNFADLNTSSIGSNLVSFNLSQPLSFYSSLKWDKKIEEVKNEDERLALKRDKIAIKHQAVLRYFDLLIAQEELLLLEKIYYYSNDLYEKSLHKYEHEKISHQDLLKIKINLNDAKIKYEDASNSYLLDKNDLLVFLKLDDIENVKLSIPQGLQGVKINDKFALERVLEFNIYNKEKITSLSSIKNIKYFKSQLFGNASLNISGGINSSSDTYSHLYDNVRK
jgi:outer membrane protein TolC